jgi:hypothetical protein
VLGQARQAARKPAHKVLSRGAQWQSKCRGPIWGPTGLGVDALHSTHAPREKQLTWVILRLRGIHQQQRRQHILPVHGPAGGTHPPITQPISHNSHLVSQHWQAQPGPGSPAQNNSATAF